MNKSNLTIGFQMAMTLGIALFASPNIYAADCPTGPALTAGTQTCSSNKTGTIGSYGWSIWSSGSGGCITPYTTTSAFKATWNNSGDYLARMGFQWNETKTYDQYGTITADYAYTKTGTGGGYSYMGIYGWSNNPLIEFYIVDDWFGGTNPPTAGGSLKDTFTVDGSKYKIYTHQQVNQPSIHGTTTFMQFFSIRQTPRQCGHISLTDHFNKWKALGMELGKLYEAKLLVEAGGGSGSIDFTVGNMTSGTIVSIAPMPDRVPEMRRGGQVATDPGVPGMVSLLALDGRVIQTLRQETSQPVSFSTHSLSRGTYFRRFVGEGRQAEMRKIMLP